MSKHEDMVSNPTKKRKSSTKKQKKPTKIDLKILELEPHQKTQVRNVIDAFIENKMENRQITSCLKRVTLPNERKMSGYMLYVQEMQKMAKQSLEVDGEVVNPKQVMIKIGEMWKAQSEDEKDAYNNEAAEMEPMQPKKQKMSGYSLFVQKMQKMAKQSLEVNGKVVKPKQVMQKLKTMWKEIEKDDRDAYINEAAKIKLMQPSVKKASVKKASVKKPSVKKPSVKKPSVKKVKKPSVKKVKKPSVKKVKKPSVKKTDKVPKASKKKQKKDQKKKLDKKTLEQLRLFGEKPTAEKEKLLKGKDIWTYLKEQ